MGAAYHIRLASAGRLLRRVNAIPIGDVLECGVGTGIYGKLWRHMGSTSWTGLDISPTAVELLRKTTGGSFFVVDLANKDDWSILE